MYCSKCGFSNQHNAKVCARCGSVLADGEATVSAASYSPQDTSVKHNGGFVPAASADKKPVSGRAQLSLSLLLGVVAIACAVLPLFSMVGDNQQAMNMFQFIGYAWNVNLVGARTFAVIPAVGILIAAVLEIICGVFAFLGKRAAGKLGLIANLLMLISSAVWFLALLSIAVSAGMGNNGGYISFVPYLMLVLPVVGLVCSVILMVKQAKKK